MKKVKGFIKETKSYGIILPIWVTVWLCMALDILSKGKLLQDIQLINKIRVYIDYVGLVLTMMLPVFYCLGKSEGTEGIEESRRIREPDNS